MHEYYCIFDPLIRGFHGTENPNESGSFFATGKSIINDM